MVLLSKSLSSSFSACHHLQESAGGSLTASMRGSKGYGRAGRLQLTQVSPHIEQAQIHHAFRAFSSQCDSFFLSLGDIDGKCW